MLGSLNSLLLSDSVAGGISRIKQATLTTDEPAILSVDQRDWRQRELGCLGDQHGSPLASILGYGQEWCGEKKLILYHGPNLGRIDGRQTPGKERGITSTM